MEDFRPAGFSPDLIHEGAGQCSLNGLVVGKKRPKIGVKEQIVIEDVVKEIIEYYFLSCK